MPVIEVPTSLQDGAIADCHIRLCAFDTGLTYLLTGLAQLARMGKIRLSQEVVPRPNIEHSRPWYLRDKDSTSSALVVDGRGSAFIDIHDSWEIDETALASHSIYFKRSLNLARIAPRDHANLRPLGLLHDLRSDGLDLFEARRIWMQHLPRATRLQQLTTFATHSLAGAMNRGRRATLRVTTAAPDPYLAPRVLFMAALWDPQEVPAEDFVKRAEFEAINEMRVQCVRLLRREFGKRFFGGVLRTPFALRCFPDEVLRDDSLTGKRAYLSLVRAFPICVATTGLHESNGWKLAEYVSMSRAIVSEPLRYSVPGKFEPGKNYLPFVSATECVDQVARLMSSEDSRAALMQCNFDYYRAWMRPDIAAWRIIQLTRAASRS